MSPGQSSPAAVRRATRLALIFLALAALPTPALAYIGPGAGFALLSSFAVLLTTLVLALFALLLLPFRMLYRAITRRRPAKALVKRLIVVGFDGQDPKLTDRYMKEGKLPHFSKLAQSGCYHRLQTSYPAVSPAAWSSFSTGTHPAKHNIFDFLNRDRRTYLPLLSSTHIGNVERFLKIGKYRIPLKKPEVRLLRRSKPTWAILGEHNIWSTVLRVPITFPPDKFHGAELSAMCAPDLLGTQGTFLLYTTRKSEKKFKEGGIRIPLEKGSDRFETRIQGPENMFIAGHPPLEVPMTIEMDRKARRARVNIGGEAVELEERKLSRWITLTFKAAPGIKVSGVCRVMVTEMGEEFSLYVTPLNIDPEKPAMPISHPSYYATYMAKKIGPYATLGLAEDTWALNEGVTDDATFLRQTHDIDDERKAMLFAAMEKLRRGSLVCVFDGTDRIQHMFWRYMEKGHPAPVEKNGGPGPTAIEEVYKKNDVLVGQIMGKMTEGDLLMVISDHGFASFRRGVNLNRWLLDNGYLALKEGADGSTEWLSGVDWSRTKAYVLGLTGMWLNLKGREAHGIVEPGNPAQELKRELMAKLRGLRDEEKREVGINEMFDTAALYQGPYLSDAPDLIIGYNAGYRVSWDCATGMISGPVFEDNRKAWSGDHCIDPRLVPGIFLCSKKIRKKDPALIDIAPTTLRLFGLDPPKHMDGEPLLDAEAFSRG